MSNVEDQIRSRVEAFAAELAVLVRRAAFDAVQASLGAPAAPATRGKAAPAHREAPIPSAKVSPRAAARGRPAARPAPAGRHAGPAKAAAGAVRRPGEKRDPRDLVRLVERLADHVKGNPGQRIEQINKALGIPTKDLTLPIKKLLLSNRITAKGEKRATSYWPR
jgi:hypothetical protein